VGEADDFQTLLNLERFLCHSGFSGSLGTLLSLLKSDMPSFHQKALGSQQLLFLPHLAPKQRSIYHSHCSFDTSNSSSNADREEEIENKPVLNLKPKYLM